jgi:SAM-dependent methyltransferase
MCATPVLKDIGGLSQALRDVLAAARFTPDDILATIGVCDAASIKERDPLLLVQRTRGGSPLETLIRLFLIEMAVDTVALQNAIKPMTLEEWVRMGLIEIDGKNAAAQFKLVPYQDMVIAYDLPRRLLAANSQDYVMGIGGSSLTLANLTVRRHSRTTLDLGTGCGFQAFLAAGHSDRVIAVDRNSRAVELSAFNASLNNFLCVECREGDLFGPVEGITFDLIVSNPPFVISPETRYIYRDSGMAGDEVCRRIVREAPRFLNEGGICQILCNWAEFAGQDWRERLKEWFEGSGCDVWIMRNQSRDVATYAATWLRHTEKLEIENLAERFAEWLAYYEKSGIEHVGGGVITMRRRTAKRNWFHADDGVDIMYGPSGDSVLNGFNVRDFLNEIHDDSELLPLPFLLCSDIRLVKQLMPQNGEWIEETSQIHMARGLANKGEIDPYMERFLIRCDGVRTLGNLIEEMAASLGVEQPKIESTLCRIVRVMIEKGVLIPRPPAA